MQGKDPDLKGQKRGGGLRHIGLLLAQVLVALYVVINAIAVPVFRPIIRGLERLQFELRLEALFRHVPPYAILVVLLIPFLSAEPAKVYAVYLMGTGHFLLGGAIFVGAYFVSLVLVEQVYQAGKSKLRTLPWFARATDWFFAFRDRIIDWAKSTPAWRAALRLERRLRETVLRWRRRCANWFASLWA